MRNASTVTMNLEGEMKRRGITTAEMFNAMGMQRATWNRRKSDPRNWTVGELMDASKLMRLPIEKFFEEVK